VISTEIAVAGLELVSEKRLVPGIGEELMLELAEHW
jgi:hypothetical protein